MKDEEIIRFYRGRGHAENYIRELKNGYDMQGDRASTERGFRGTGGEGGHGGGPSSGLQTLIL